MKAKLTRSSGQISEEGESSAVFKTSWRKELQMRSPKTAANINKRKICPQPEQKEKIAGSTVQFQHSFIKIFSDI